jgi:hypothetical protein
MTTDAVAPLSRTPGVRDRLLAVGPVVLAFLAGQHHALHMAILMFGVGTAGAAFMTAYPDLRRVMLGVSLIVALFAGYRATRPDRPRAMRITYGASVLSTLLVVGWSIMDFGL